MSVEVLKFVYSFLVTDTVSLEMSSWPAGGVNNIPAVYKSEGTKKSRYSPALVQSRLRL